MDALESFLLKQFESSMPNALPVFSHRHGHPFPASLVPQLWTLVNKAMSLFFNTLSSFVMGFPGGSEAEASACNAGDLGSIPGLGRSPGEGNGSPLQYSCLENPMDGEDWWAMVHGVAKSWTRLSDFTSLHRFVTVFLPRSKHLLISWLQSLSTMIFEPQYRIKSLKKNLLFAQHKGGGW